MGFRDLKDTGWLLPHKTSSEGAEYQANDKEDQNRDEEKD
jgi:hypothetical protein